MRTTKAEPVKKLLFWIVQWTWGLPQNVAGLVWLLVNHGRPHRWFHGALVTSTSGWEGGVSLGMFVFIYDNMLAPGWIDSTDTPEERARRPHAFKRTDTLVRHEFGHCIQSLILGPLYLLTVGISSFIWARAPYFQKRRRRAGIDYYSLWCERWANNLGDRFIKH